MDDKLTTSPDYLLQMDIVENILTRIGNDKWLTLYQNDDGPSHRLGIFCALLEDSAVKIALERDGWDLMVGDGKPGFVKSYKDKNETITYNRYGMNNGIRPMVIHRSFHGAHPEYCEIDEEFRLFHDLAEDKKKGRLITFDSSGRDIEVVRIDPSNVEAQIKHIKQFQAATQLHLAIFIDSVRYSLTPLQTIPAEEQNRKEIVNTRRWLLAVRKAEFKSEFETFSRLLGKIILPPPPQRNAGVWPFNENPPAEVSFIIGLDENGNNTEYTSNPDKLANNFGANPKSPHYLTPVFFRREVLNKYYSEPHRYKVSDGHLSCNRLWGCQIDNNIRDYVSVFLGDLGRDLPFEERLHWRQFNTPPEGCISDTNLRRSFLSQFCSPESLDLLFRSKYTQLNSEWMAMFGWPLFLPLTKGDAHLIETVRIPATDSQSELDEQILHLTKLLVDSLNEKELTDRAEGLEKDTKGIGKLNGFFGSTKFPDGAHVVQYLKDLQALRSTGSGHRKGSAYDKNISRMGLESNSRQEIMSVLLKEAISSLQLVRKYYLKDIQI